MEVWKHIRAIVLLPIAVILVIPSFLILVTDSLNLGWSLTPPLNLVLLAAGCVLIFSGLALLVTTIAMFATVGRGTLAPWDPTQRLVLRGVYLHVRNPMISGVFCVLLGEAVSLGSVPVLGWFLVFLVGNMVYIPLVEEADLEGRFGEEYRRYKENVPRWIPRLTPWDGRIDGDGRQG